MEFVVILLSSLFGILSPTGLVLENLATSALRDRLEAAETLEVRIDNVPAHQIVRGRVDRVRVAGRGIFPVEGVRIAVVEVETDAIAVDPNRVSEGRAALERPLQAGVRLVLNRDDINQALRSPEITRQLQDVSLDLLQTENLRRYEFVDPRVEFLPDQRIRLRATLQEQAGDRELQILMEFGVGVVAGHQLQIQNLSIRINDEPFPEEFTRRLASGISQHLDLRRLEAAGLTVRILQWDIEADHVAIAAFIRLTPTPPPETSAPAM